MTTSARSVAHRSSRTRDPLLTAGRRVRAAPCGANTCGRSRRHADSAGAAREGDESVECGCGTVDGDRGVEAGGRAQLGRDELLGEAEDVRGDLLLPHPRVRAHLPRRPSAPSSTRTWLTPRTSRSPPRARRGQQALEVPGRVRRPLSPLRRPEPQRGRPPPAVEALNDGTRCATAWSAYVTLICRLLDVRTDMPTASGAHAARRSLLAGFALQPRLDVVQRGSRHGRGVAGEPVR